MKDVERVMGISYPTIKARLSRLNNALGPVLPDISPVTISEPVGSPLDPDQRSAVLDRLASGEIDAGTATKILRGELTDETEERD